MIRAALLDEMVFFDIETVGMYANLEEYRREDPAGAEMLVAKIGRRAETDITWKGDPGEVYLRKAGLTAEFGKIVCICVGTFSWPNETGQPKADIDTVTGSEEVIIARCVSVFSGFHDKTICGFNIRGFDIPWLNKKCLVHGWQVPEVLKVYGHKPWELSILDLSELWRSGGFDYASLEECAHSLGFSSPKEDVRGSEVHQVFYGGEGGIDRIAEYCKRDVKTVMCIAYKLSALRSLAQPR